ncbi:MAG: hypothetical protein K9L82_06760 [Chromatiaceae bacterium]|nr:hypothetical protein [Chromatiaceae bacterium]MCF8014468.1 hypothetical protein [Chromatiaceae bacterium]
MTGIYNMHASLLKKGSLGVLESDVLGGQLFEPTLRAELAAASTDPLRAGADGQIDSFEVTSLPTTAESASASAAVLVVVDGEAATVQLDIDQDEAGIPRIIGLRYEDQAYGTLAADESLPTNPAQEIEPTPGELGAASPSDAKAEAMVQPDAASAQASASTPTSHEPTSHGKVATADDDQAVNNDSPEETTVIPIRADFSGTALPDGWTVLSEDAQSYLPEPAGLFVIASGGDDRFDHKRARNLFALDIAMPEGDWDQTLTGTFKAKTGYEMIWNGVYESPDRFVAAQLTLYPSGCGNQLFVAVTSSRTSENGGRPIATRFHRNLLDGPVADDMCGSGRELGDAIIAALDESGYALTLSRHGLRYEATVELTVPDTDGGTRRARVTTPAVSHIGQFGRPTFMLGQFGRAGGRESESVFKGFEIASAEEQ